MQCVQIKSISRLFAKNLNDFLKTKNLKKQEFKKIRIEIDLLELTV